jgi:hypothetical protein
MGRDPQGERKEATRLEQTRLDVLLDAYEKHLAARKVVNQQPIMSLLRRELLGGLGKVHAETVRRRDVADRVAKLEAGGKPGAAQDLRAKATTFFGWAVNQDLIYANPLAGWRRERATRAQMAVRPGKSLSADELKAVWLAGSSVAAPFGGPAPAAWRRRARPARPGADTRCHLRSAARHRVRSGFCL